MKRGLEDTSLLILVLSSVPSLSRALTLMTWRLLSRWWRWRRRRLRWRWWCWWRWWWWTCILHLRRFTFIIRALMIRGSYCRKPRRIYQQSSKMGEPVARRRSKKESLNRRPIHFIDCAFQRGRVILILSYWWFDTWFEWDFWPPRSSVRCIHVSIRCDMAITGLVGLTVDQAWLNVYYRVFRKKGSMSIIFQFFDKIKYIYNYWSIKFGSKGVKVKSWPLSQIWIGQLLVCSFKKI